MAEEKNNMHAGTFEAFLCEAAREDPKITLVTYAGIKGTALQCFQDRYPDRFITAGDAVETAASLAKAGQRPVAAVPSFFLPDACSRIMYEVCIQKLPVLFIVDHAGFSDCSRRKRQGIFSLSYLSVIPDLCIMTPKNGWELKEMLRFALDLDSPAAVFIPAQEVCSGGPEFCAPVVFGQSETMYDEQDIALLAEGNMVHTAMEVRRALRDLGYGCSLINMRFVKPLDEKAVIRAAADHLLLVTLEDNVRMGGMGDAVLECLADIGSAVPVLNIALPDEYAGQENMSERRQEAGIDAETIIKRIVTRYIGLYQV